ncbi:putative inner membrane protein [Sporomusa ovata DSM 2662]|uniref:Membrane protein, putative n=1 Tax=Sporomusa ovata TaxID=2378 RepID=A0A0U1KZ45_9FIRM|nr:YeeE/YedE thiosulfate transporter family protein [Sporomusa ovata]EQB28977.1 sulfur transport [Sporomusa ovata DSM 2662]CQR72409.1 membrane protein, putative [Sporomusa ovata]
MMVLLYGLITGILFGFLLQKGRVLRYDKQIAALRLQDMTIVKFMLSHIAVAMVGVYFLYDMGLVKLSLKPTVLGGVIIGGVLFGLGWGLLGYCPGTSLGALGEGRWDSVWGILGMLAGAGMYAEMYPYLQKTVLTWGNYGKITVPQVLGVNHWLVIVSFLIVTVLLFRWLERKGL